MCCDIVGDSTLVEVMLLQAGYVVLVMVVVLLGVGYSVVEEVMDAATSWMYCKCSEVMVVIVLLREYCI